MPIPAAIIPALISAAGAVAGAGIKFGTDRANINRQNRYNSPMEQLRRLRQAGLPYGAYAAGQAGNQSTVQTGTDAGLTQAGQNIGQYYSTKKQIEEINKIKEDIQAQKLANEKLNAELVWYRAGAGSDPSRTNLTSMLALERDIKGLQSQGMDYANTIASYNAKNHPYKLQLENTEQSQRIANMLQANKKGEYEIEGAKLNNALREIELQYKPRMSQAELESILTRNDIQITDKGLKQLQYNLDAATYENKIAISDIERMSNMYGMQNLGLNYQNNKQWQSFNEKARALFNKEKGKMSLSEYAQALSALFYATIGGPSGKISSPIFNFPQQ